MMVYMLALLGQPHTVYLLHNRFPHMDIQVLQQTMVRTAESYGVDPVTFGVIYVVAIPFFLASVAWLMRCVRNQQSVVLPATCSSFFFLSSYLYVLAVGDNMPVWVYVVMGVMIAYGIGATVLKVRWQLQERDCAAEVEHERGVGPTDPFSSSSTAEHG
jgi:hypothetical protein